MRTLHLFIVFLSVAIIAADWAAVDHFRGEQPATAEIASPHGEYELAALLSSSDGSREISIESEYLCLDVFEMHIALPILEVPNLVRGTLQRQSIRLQI